MKTTSIVIAVTAAILVPCLVIRGPDAANPNASAPVELEKGSLDDWLSLAMSADSDLRLKAAKELGNFGREAKKDRPPEDKPAAAARPHVSQARPADGPQERPRLLVLTDIGGDPDDQQSMVRLMTYSNEFDIEGLIASASGTPGEPKREIVQPQLIREIVEGYGKVRESLLLHDPAFPPAEKLLDCIKSGNPLRGLKSVGAGHDTEGSQWIVSVTDRPDPRPLNIAIWGGQTDLAQALWRVRQDRGESGVKAFLATLRVYLQARMAWCVKPFSQANHRPIALLNGDRSKRVLHIAATAGAELKLSAAGSSDPDGNRLSYRWWMYSEAGTYGGKVMIRGHEQAEAEVVVPAGADGKTIHVNLEVRDDGQPSLTSYRRAVLEVKQPATKVKQPAATKQAKADATVEKPYVTIDAGKTGKPISKYVYGQFIEHLGRCIYGGIWAEMIEDRKFFYPVDAKESPWKSIDGATVTMVSEDAFVGQHTPRVTLGGDQPRGIAQDGLGLVHGKTYKGYVWLAAKDADAVQVGLVWGNDRKDRQVVVIEKPAEKFTKAALKFTAGATTDNGRLEVTALGKGSVSIGIVSLMPADNICGMRADTFALLQELDSPVYRWPGGNFVSGYNWKDGIGDRDHRPPRKNPAWSGVEHNDFGLDEFMVFCHYLKTEPYIAVNSGLGDTKSAVEEVEYANGSANTPMGKLRAKNGHPEPYGVKFWGIGNEMYGNWQLGYMPLDKYTQKHNEFAAAMRKVDRSIQLIGVGATGKWSETMLRDCADHMNLLSEHFYCNELKDLDEHVRQIPNAVHHKAEAHRKYWQQIESLRGKDIRIALDEWNYWYGPYVFSDFGTRYFLKDSLGIAAGIHEMARQSDVIYMANYAQTVNVLGCIKTSKTAAELETTGLVLKLYRGHFGTLPAVTQCARCLDAQAAWSTDRKTLTVAVVNPSPVAIEVPLSIKGTKLTGAGIRWQVAGADPMAYNDPGRPPKVTVVESKVQGVTDKLSLAPCSVTLFALHVK